MLSLACVVVLFFFGLSQSSVLLQCFEKNYPSLITDIFLLLVPRQGGGSWHQAVFAFPKMPKRKGVSGVWVSREKCLCIPRRCMLLTHLCTSREEMRQSGRKIFLHTSDVHCSGRVILAVLPKVVFLLPSVSACFIAGCPLNSTIINPSQTLHWTRTVCRGAQPISSFASVESA